MSPLEIAFRLIALVAAMPSLWAAYRCSPFSHGDDFGPALCLAFASLAILCVWFGARGHLHRDRVVLLWATIAGVTAGGLGIVAGIAYYVVFYPKSNIAPVLAFFVTGPYAAAGGVIAGVIAGLFATRRRSVP
jgi:hypothetical protein